MVITSQLILNSCSKMWSKGGDHEDRITNRKLYFFWHGKSVDNLLKGKRNKEIRTNTIKFQNKDAIRKLSVLKF